MRILFAEEKKAHDWVWGKNVPRVKVEIIIKYREKTLNHPTLGYNSRKDWDPSTREKIIEFWYFLRELLNAVLNISKRFTMCKIERNAFSHSLRLDLLLPFSFPPFKLSFNFFFTRFASACRPVPPFFPHPRYLIFLRHKLFANLTQPPLPSLSLSFSLFSFLRHRIH